MALCCSEGYLLFALPVCLPDFAFVYTGKGGDDAAETAVVGGGGGGGVL